MKLTQWFAFVFVAVLAVVYTTARGAPPDQSIAIETAETSYILTVPVSRLRMTIPKGHLVLKSSPRGEPNNPRYFYFQDSKVAFIVSGWFEPASGFSGIERFWQNETNAWKRNGLPEAQDVSFTKIGNWDSVVYETKLPRGTNAHIRAHWVQAGTWIDVHLSLTSTRTSTESRKLLESYLRTISVEGKT
jgi:hypothetical protein